MIPKEELEKMMKDKSAVFVLGSSHVVTSAKFRKVCCSCDGPVFVGQEYKEEELRENLRSKGRLRSEELKVFFVCGDCHRSRILGDERVKYSLTSETLDALGVDEETGIALAKMGFLLEKMKHQGDSVAG